MQSGAFAAAEPRPRDADAARRFSGTQASRSRRGGWQFAQEPSRYRRPFRENPHLQFPARPDHRPPHQRELRQHPRDPRRRSRKDRREAPGRREIAAARRIRLGRLSEPEFRRRTIGETLQAARASLEATSESAQADAQILLAFVLGCEHSELPARDDAEIGETQQTDVETLVAQRGGGMPVAYLIGSAWFYGRPFEVTRDVLVPRPETEHLIEAALDDLRAEKKTDVIVVDVGTGSGAIAITLACELPELSVIATDISKAALAVGRRNAALLGVAEP